MNRRDFLKTATATLGALALPGAALAADPRVVGIDYGSGTSKGVYTIYRAVGLVSGWTKEWHGQRDHYTPEAVFKVFEMAEAKLSQGRVPLYDNYDESKPPVAWVTQFRIHERREIERIRRFGDGDDLMLVPGPSTAHLEVEFASLRDDLTGKFVGPTLCFSDGLPTTGESPVEMITGLGNWSIHDSTKFLAPDMTVRKGGLFVVQEAHYVGKIPPRTELLIG